MNTRSKRFRRWPCELTDVQIERIRELSQAQLPERIYFTEMTRRLINHALNCPFFDPTVSSERNVQPPDQREGATP